jgi:hypothetical protein
MLLTNYGCKTAVGRLLQALMELFMLELDMGAQPFKVNFRWHGQWVTDSWLKSLWEKVYLFGIVIEEGKVGISPPQEGDEWLMPLFCKLNYNSEELVQVLFLSNVMDAQGTIIDTKYAHRRPESEH